MRVTIRGSPSISGTGLARSDCQALSDSQTLTITQQELERYVELKELEEERRSLRDELLEKYFSQAQVEQGLYRLHVESSYSQSPT